MISKHERKIRTVLASDLENLAISLKQANPDTVRRIREILDLFSALFISLLPSGESFKRLTAFAIYNIECLHLLRRATVETFSCHYGIGYTLLRSALEGLIRGTFWECMAHRSFRERTDRGRFRGIKLGAKTGTIVDWFEDVIEHSPETEQSFDSISGSIFDRVAPLFREPSLNRVVPTLKSMVEQIADWGMLEPMEEPVGSVYEFLYSQLSDYAHLIPDKTLIGSRLVAGKSFTPAVEFKAEELECFLGALSCVVDIGLLLILNLTSGVLGREAVNREKLANHAAAIQTLLPELFSARHIQSL